MTQVLSLMVLFASIAGVAASASAVQIQEPLVCSDQNSVPDKGYNLAFTKGQKSVSVEAVTIAGAKEIANLKCSKPAPPKKPVGADEPVIVLVCGSEMADAGYSVTVIRGGFMGGTTADLYEENIAGAKFLAEFKCVYGK